jgi:hypothetical protein
MPHYRHIVGYNPQKLLPAPRPKATFTIDDINPAHLRRMWGEPSASPLDDIDEFRRLVMGTGTLKAAFVDMEMLEKAKPASRVEIYDYGDHIWVSPSYSDFADEMTRRIADAVGVSYDLLTKNYHDATGWLGDAKEKSSAPKRKRQPSYLAHDPTKSHRRRRR